jgi:hypothetical protein
VEETKQKEESDTLETTLAATRRRETCILGFYSQPERGGSERQQKRLKGNAPTQETADIYDYL